MLLDAQAVTPASSGSKRKTCRARRPGRGVSASTTTTVPRREVADQPEAGGLADHGVRGAGPEGAGDCGRHRRRWGALLRRQIVASSASSRRTTATPTPSSPSSVLPRDDGERRRASARRRPSSIVGTGRLNTLAVAVRARSSAPWSPPLEPTAGRARPRTPCARGAFLPEEHQRELPGRLDGDDVDIAAVMTMNIHIAM